MLNYQIIFFKGDFFMAVKKQMSQEAFEKLEKELAYLVTVKRAEVAQKLKEARSFGDLSENAEYDEAKNEQAILEAQINEIQYTIDNAEIVSDENISVDEIGMSSIMKIRRVGSDKIETFTIVASNQVNVKEGKISDESPIGKAALKKKVGDLFIVNAPIGDMEYEVIEISK